MPGWVYDKSRPVRARARRVSIDRQANTLENRFLRCNSILPGHVRSLVDKKSGRELIDSESEFAWPVPLRALQQNETTAPERVHALQVRGGDRLHRQTGCPGLEVPYRRSSPRDFEVSWSASPVPRAPSCRARTRNWPGLAAVSLAADLPYVYCKVISDRRPTPGPRPLALPALRPGALLRMGRLGASSIPARHPARVNQHLFCLNTAHTQATATAPSWVSVPCITAGQCGLPAFPVLAPLHSRRPVVFINLYNNQWPTDFPQ